MTELIVLAMCINGMACTETLGAYKAQNPIPFKRLDTTVKNTLNEYSNDQVTFIVGSLLITGIKKELRIKVSRNIVFTGQSDEVKLIYNLGF